MEFGIRMAFRAAPAGCYVLLMNRSALLLAPGISGAATLTGILRAAVRRRGHGSGDVWHDAPVLVPVASTA
jgi:hypothetical protein